jgi:hypothetical protein
MNPITNKAIKIFLISGLNFACINAGIDYLREIEFRWSKFIISGFLFGLLMAIFSWHEHRKKESQKQNQ